MQQRSAVFGSHRRASMRPASSIVREGPGICSAPSMNPHGPTPELQSPALVLLQHRSRTPAVPVTRVPGHSPHQTIAQDRVRRAACGDAAEGLPLIFHGSPTHRVAGMRSPTICRFDLAQPRTPQPQPLRAARRGCAPCAVTHAATVTDLRHSSTARTRGAPPRGN